jgi:NADPH:quinone reductase-like Zn-dependent oxidoreductase
MAAFATEHGSRMKAIRVHAFGKLRTIIDRTYALEDAADALTQSASDHARGKILVQITPKL